MYVMLVDDETIILNGVSRFLKRKWPSIELEKFENGFDALEAMRIRMPHLLITDISMPELSGIELVAKAQALGLQNSVMLTGYDEFTLVQKALRLGTLDYLLKPVDKEELYAVVERVWKATDQEAVKKKQLLINSLRLMCMFGLQPQELLLPIDLTSYWQEQDTSCLLVLLDGNLTQSTSTNQALSALSELALDRYALGHDRVNNELVLYLTTAENNQAGLALARELSKQPVFRGISSAKLTAESLNTAYRQALEGTESGLQQSVQTYLSQESDSNGTLLALDSLFFPRRLFGERLNILRRFASAIGCRFAIWDAAVLLCNYTNRVEDERLQALSSWLSSLHVSVKPHSPEVLQGLDYIDQNFREELSLTHIAQLVYLPSSYFSTLFHKETGHTYVDYINRARINDACLRILEDANVSVDSISAAVGYENPHYFFKVFKRYTSMTPGAFRQLAR